MRKWPGSYWTRLALVLAGAASLLAVMGCDDSRSADKRVLKAVQQARIDQMKGGIDSLDAAQSALQKAQTEASSASGTATKAYATAMLAQAELDNAVARISDPDKGIDPDQRQARQILWEISQLTDQIRACNNLAIAYAKLKPTEAGAQVREALQAANGSDNAPWIAGGDGKLAVPSLSAVKADVDRLQNQVQKQQDHLKQLQQQQQQLAQQADQEMTTADTLKGQAGVDQFRAAAKLRKQAQDLASQVEVEQAKLVPMQQDLALAQARQQAISASIEQFQKLGQQLDSGWKDVAKQAQRQQEIAAAVLNGGSDGTGTTESIKQKSEELAKVIRSAKAVYDAASANLQSAIQHFDAARAAADQLGREIQQQTANLPPGKNAMRDALQTLRQVYDPATFKLEQANAQLALANLQSAHAQMLVQRQAVEHKLADVLKEANLEIPTTLADAKLPDEIKSVAREAADNYKAANESFLDVSSGGNASETDKNGGRAGNVYALYGQALLGRMTHDPKAAELFAAAQSQRDQVLTDSPMALTVLPAELVVTTPTTAPSTAPASPSR